jgi:hypothetical protein
MEGEGAKNATQWTSALPITKQLMSSPSWYMLRALAPPHLVVLSPEQARLQLLAGPWRVMYVMLVLELKQADPETPKNLPFALLALL